MSLPAAASATQRSNRMRGSSITTPKFPFPEDAFASARLSAQQLHAHDQQIQQLIAQALDECERADVMGRSAYSDSWEVVGVQDSVTALRRVEPTASHTHTTASTSHKSQFRLIGDVVSNYRDLMALYYADTSNDLFEWLQFMYQSTLDAHIIQTTESQSSSKPHQYFGVKWAVFQMSMFATKVDQCFVEYMTYCKDRRGREVGVRVTLPIRIPEIDLTMDALKVRRMASLMVQILRPVNDKTTRTFVLIENDFPLASPAAYVKTLLELSENTALGMDARRIRRRGLVAEKDWIPNSSRRNCVVCMRTFGATRGRHHCRLCGDVICRKCTVVRDTADPVTRKTFKLAKTKFCVVCIVNLQVPTADASGGDAAAQPIAVVDLSASRVAAVVGVSSSKTRGMDYMPSDSVDEGSRSSMWSETESEGYNGEFDYSDSARTSLSSSYSDPQDAEKHSFGKRLQEIAERVEEMAVDESTTTTTATTTTTTKTTTTSRKSRPTDLVLFIPDDDDVIETIDTKDMIRGNCLGTDESESPLSASGIYTLDEYTHKRGRSNSTNPPSSTRSLDQNLAEQEALLRQMVMATHGVVTPRYDDDYDQNYQYEYDA